MTASAETEIDPAPGGSSAEPVGSPDGGNSRVRRAIFAAKALVSGGLIWLLLRGQDAGALAQTLTALPLWAAVAAPATILAMIGLITQRWRVITARLGAPQPGGLALRLSFIGQFFSQGLPTSFGGDAMRVWLLYRRGTGLGMATRGVLLDRMTALIALLTMVAVGVPLLPAYTDDRLVLLSLGGLAAVGFGGLVLFLLLCRIARWLPADLATWTAIAQLARLSAEARGLLLSPGAAGKVLGLSLLGHAGSVLAVWILARGLGLDLPLGAAFCVMPPVILATALPISIAGWGVREGVMVGAFSLLGLSAEGALAVSVLFGLALILTALPGAPFWLAMRGSGGRPPTNRTVTVHPP